MNRDTKTITTPLGKTVVLKTYMTAREREQLVKIFEGLDKEMTDKIAKGEAGTEKSIESAKKYVDIMVVKYGTVDSPVSESLLDLPVEEYDFVVTEAIKAATGGFQQVK